MSTTRKDGKPAFAVIEGGKSSAPENPGGPDYGAGIKAEEAKDRLKPLTPEEVDDMHREELPGKE